MCYKKTGKARAFRHPDLSPPDRHVLLVLADCYNAEEKLCNPSIERIAEETGLSESRIYKAIATLIRIGVVLRGFGLNGLPQYEFNFKDPVSPTEKDSRQDSPQENNFLPRRIRFSHREQLSPQENDNIRSNKNKQEENKKEQEDSSPASLVPDEPDEPAVEEKKPRKDPNTGEPTRFVFALKDGTDWTLNTDLLNVFNASFPDIDVDRHLGAAMAWTRTAIPSKRKTATGMPAFIRNWLTRQATDARFTPQKPNVAAKQNANAEYEATMAEAYRLKQEQEAAFERNKAAYAQRSKGLQPT